MNNVRVNTKTKEYATNHYQELFNRFLNLAINRFTWENLPMGLDNRIIEESLIRNGRIMFFRDTTTEGLLCLPATGTGRFNVYNEPIEYNVIGLGYTNTISIDDGVIIKNNALGTPDLQDLQMFADRINEVEQTMDVNLVQQATPYILSIDEQERQTAINLFKQILNKRFAIFTSKNMMIGKNEVLKTDAPFLLDKLQAHKNSLMNELLTFLGINNNNVEKRERLLVDEVNANNDFILVNLDHMYDERERAVKLINEKFGTNIIVNKREVETDGNLYNGIAESTRWWF